MRNDPKLSAQQQQQPKVQGTLSIDTLIFQDFHFIHYINAFVFIIYKKVLVVDLQLLHQEQAFPCQLRLHRDLKPHLEEVTKKLNWI